MRDHKAEACRRSADKVRQIALGAGTVHEQEAFRQLADGYDVLAEQLEQIAKRGAKTRDGVLGLDRAFPSHPHQ